MSIEFFCDACFTKVVTPDSTAGKKGRCPNCGKVVDIPADQTPASAPQTISLPENYVPPQGGPSSGVADDIEIPDRDKKKLTADEKRLKTKLGDYEWESKKGYKNWGNFNPVDRHAIKKERRLVTMRSIAAPGVALLVTAIVNMIVMLITISVLSVMVIIQFMREQQMTNDVQTTQLVIWCIALSLWLSIFAVIIIGANHMRMARNYSMAMTGAVVAVLPINPCLILTIPFGIWAIMVLANKNVRLGFRST